MKRTSKFLVLLAATMMLVGCGNKNKNSSSSTPAPSNTPNDINVVYVKSYVSDARAEEMKNAYIQSLTAAGVTVDASKINFFSTQNSTVAAYTDEILQYNEANPTNQIDVVLGANGFGNAEEESRTTFLAKYTYDEVDYTYGTHSNEANRINRKFWYDKEKANDTYVKGLQTYLQANWTTYVPPVPVETGKLTVMVYSVFVSEARLNEMKTGFQSYLTAHSVTIDNLVFVHETTTSTIPTFMEKVAEYDEEHADAKVDALLGLKTNSAITAAGFINDGTAYNYGDKDGDPDANADRRFWYKELTTEVAALQSYLRESWVPAPDPEYYLMGEMNSWNTADETYHFAKVDDNTYTLANFQATAGLAVRVYCPQTTEWFRNATTPADCGYTIGDAPDYNVIITVAGKYTVTFKVTDADNNHISLEAQTLPVFRIAFYNKFIDNANITSLKNGIEAAFTTASLEVQFVYTELGTGNYTSATSAIVSGTQVVLGYNNSSNASNALTPLGYEAYSEQAYTYGTDTARLLWVLSTAKTSPEVVAVFNYLEANWK